MGFSPAIYACSAHSEGLGEGRGVVLLVEDNDTVASLVTYILGRVGRKVVRAEDGKTCARLVQEYGERLALVILDCRLPDMDGAVLCRQLRAERPGLPVLLTSGRTRGQEAIAGAGASGFLPKPFRPADVERQVSALIGAHA